MRAVLCLGLALWALPQGMALASSEREPAEKAAHPVRLQPDEFSAVSSAARVVWSWPTGRRLYQLINPSANTQSEMVAYDADRLVEVARRQLTPAPWWSKTNAWFTSGQHLTMAVDEHGGRLFIPHEVRSAQSFAGEFDSAGQTKPCPTSYSFGCVGGIHVLDASTLESLGAPIDLSPLRLDGGAFAPVPRALAYAPPLGDTEGGKLLMLVEDIITDHITSWPQARPRLSGVAVHYVVQFDPDRRVQEWAVRVDGCRGVREPAGDASAQADERAFPAAIYRTVGAEGPTVVVGCHSPGQTGTVVRVPLDEHGFPASLPARTAEPDDLAGSVAEGDDPRRLQPSDVAAPTAGQQAFFGPDKVFEIIADPLADRVLMRVEDNRALVWWVFDNRIGAFVGTIGIGPYGGHVDGTRALAGLDPSTGRLYQLAGEQLFVADTRRTPLAQALLFPMPLPGHGYSPLSVVTSSDEAAPTRVFVPVGPRSGETDPKVFRIIEDRLPVNLDPPGELFAGRTLDLGEAEGVTAVSADGAARGYGGRVLLLGGADGTLRAGPADPLTTVRNWYMSALGNKGNKLSVPGPVDTLVVSPPCSSGSRDVTLGFVGPSGPAVVDGTGSRGAAEPVVMDTATRADMEAAASRCTGVDWDGLWSTALFGRPPTHEPTVPWPFSSRAAECVAKDEDVSDRVGDPVTGAFAAKVSCVRGEEASGFSYARGVEVAGVRIAEALSSYRIYRDPGRGMVSRVESVARGVAVDSVRIDGIRGVAESWANGRTQPVANADRPDGYNPNCDFDRTAGTCFTRHLFGLSTPAYRCGPCGDERTFVDRLSRALGANAAVRLRDPDPALHGGAHNGFLAAIQKPSSERFADLTLNNDTLQTVLPTLEIIRYTTAGGQLLTSDYQAQRARQIVQLAGVEVSSSYGIQCLLVYDEANNTCRAVADPSGALAVQLHDPEGKPLAGGMFEVRADTDADGLAGLSDALVPGGACLTADDGIGTCRFDTLAPGAYLVTQIAAPPGHTRVDDAFPVDLAPGEQRTVTFTNASNIATITVTATGPDGRPLAGASFAVHPDPDGDGAAATGAPPTATCTTGPEGICTMHVPAGSYLLTQTSAPDGLAPTSPISFTLTTGGQTAAVGIVNYPPDTPAPAPAPRYTTSTPTVPVNSPSTTATIPLPISSSTAHVQPATRPLGATITQIIRVPGDALRLFTRDPQQAAALTATLALLIIAALATQRRRTTVALLAAAAPHTSLAPRQPVRPPSRSGPGSGAPASRRTTAPAARPSRIRTVAGGAPSAMEQAVARVVAATANPTFTELLGVKLRDVARCELLTVVSTPSELRGAIRGSSPDVLVVDLALPTGQPEDICDLLPLLHPLERIVGLIPPGRSLEALAVRAYNLRLGGVLGVDDTENGQLAYAVRCVAAGKPVVGPTVYGMLRRMDRDSRSKRLRLLTPREIEVALLAVDGLPRRQIADRLHLSTATVKGHLHSVRAKLGVADPWNREQLRKRLQEVGVLESSEDASK